MMRLGIGRRIDVDRMFAIWRVDPPWQPVTKKGQGQRMGGGKGAIDHYVTPIKHGRIILEVAGHCEFEEVGSIINLEFVKNYIIILLFYLRIIISIVFSFLHLCRVIDHYFNYGCSDFFI